MIVKATTLSSVWIFDLETGEYTRVPRESADHPYVPYSEGKQSFTTVDFTTDDDGLPVAGPFFVRTGPGFYDFIRSVAESVEPVEAHEFELTS